MTDATNNAYKLRLQDDALILESDAPIPETKIELKTIAFLNKNGRLEVETPNGVWLFSAVTPSDTMPSRCLDLMYFGLENQIMIFRQSAVRKFFKVNTSEPDFFTKTGPPIPESFLKVLPRNGQDTIVLSFDNNQTTLVMADPSDIEVFMKRLEQPNPSPAQGKVIRMYMDPLRFRVP